MPPRKARKQLKISFRHHWKQHIVNWKQLIIIGKTYNNVHQHSTGQKESPWKYLCPFTINQSSSQETRNIWKPTPTSSSYQFICRKILRDKVDQSSMVPQSRELIEDRSHYWLPSAHWKYHWGDDKCKLKTSNNSHSLLVLINLVGKWWWLWRKFTNRGHCEKTEHEEEEEVEEWGDGKLSDRLRVHLGFFHASIFLKH